MGKYKINFFHYSQSSILVNWPQSISIEISNDINTFSKALCNDEKIIELRKGYCSLLIQFDSENISYNHFRVNLINIYKNLKEVNIVKPSVWEVPVCYHDSFSFDMKEYSKKNSLTKDEIIQLHSSKTYYLHMYGFLPGFMYLGGLDSKLHIPRKTIPSRSVLKGSVAVGGSQTGIYPSDSPGGWYVIGNTPIDLFDASNLNQPVAIPDSNYVKFKPISIEEYKLIKQEVEKSEYKFIKSELNG
tara:strand:+ start:5358 stop:6089 length:732 start_codon:yes stop_codon:yes gene_type:complete